MHANTSSSGTSLDHHSENKKFEWTITSLNFLKVNVLEGLSKYFGDHRFTEYIFKFLPEDIFKGMTIFMVYGVYQHYFDMKNQKQVPYLVYMCVFYITFFSLLGHKENRFLLPILPFLFLMTGRGLSLMIKHKKWILLVKLLVYGSIIFEIVQFGVRSMFHNRYWDALDYVINFSDKAPHSLYSMHRFETPYYSWLHQ